MNTNSNFQSLQTTPQPSSQCAATTTTFEGMPPYMQDSVQPSFDSAAFQEQHNPGPQQHQQFSTQHPYNNNDNHKSPYQSQHHHNQEQSPYHSHQHQNHNQLHPQPAAVVSSNSHHFSMPSSTENINRSLNNSSSNHSPLIPTAYYPQQHLSSPGQYEGHTSPYPQASTSLLVHSPMHTRKSSKGKPEDICEMINSLLTDEEQPSREQLESRKSTMDYSGYGGCDNIDAITPTLMAGTAAYGWSGGGGNSSNNLLSSDYYKRKESLPSTLGFNSSMLSPPSYQCERSRSMSTVCAPNFYNQHDNQYHPNNANNHLSQPHHSMPTNHNNNHRVTLSSAANPLGSSSSSGNLSSLNDYHFAASNNFEGVVSNSNSSSSATGVNATTSSRRSKSTVVGVMPPQPACPSLHRFNSLLRKVSYVPSAGAGLASSSTAATTSAKTGPIPHLSPFNPLLSFTPYTPPPILSPMRNGTGLFCKVARNPATEHKFSCRSVNNTEQFPSSSPSLFPQSSCGRNQRMILVDDANNLSSSSAAFSEVTAMPAKDSTADRDQEVHPLECSTSSTSTNEQRRTRLVKEEQNDEEENNENCPKKRRKMHKHSSTASGSRHNHHKRSNHSKVEDINKAESASKEEGEEDFSQKFSQEGDEDELADKFDTDSVSHPTPQRKNGLFLSGTAQSGSGSSFAAELEALRKESAGSSVSNLSFHKCSVPDSSVTYHARMNMHNKLSVANEDFIRKMSSVSMDENKGRKESCISDYAGEDAPPETDAIPHINLGKNFQARVKKWADREITVQERAAIPDRDEAVFDVKVVDHLPQTCIAAYETLACSVAVPRPGRNKELALHILMENQGNIQSAVMDLLRSDTLDWEQYPLVFNNLYTDVDQWTTEDINSFQDAIYKSEKDFHQVASELDGRTVKECVAFYYTWKKACPDDYRKLRNLRRKRQLLEQQLDFSSYASRLRSQSDLMDTSEEEFSGTESDITNPSYGVHNMECSPETRAEKLARVNQTKSPVPIVRKTSTIRFTVPTTLDLPMSSPLGSGSAFSSNNNNVSGISNNNSVGYPWLHGEMFPSPSSSTTSNTHESGSANYGASNSTMTANSSSGLSDLFDMSGTESSVFSQGSGYHSQKVRGALPKKGAQPSADGFFHCRLCEKRFEKVKSLNAHMKSHAMKARAEAEAQAQLQINTNNRYSKGNDNNNSNNSNDLHMRDSPEEELNLSPLNLCQPSSAAVAAAALGLNNLNRIAAAQHSAAKMQGLLNTRDLVSVAMTHLAATSGASQSSLGMTTAQQQQFNAVQSHGLGNQQQIAAMAAAAAAAQQQGQQSSLQQQQQIEAVAAATSLSTLQQLHSNLQQQQQNLPNFQAQQQQQYPTTIIH